MIRNGFDWAAGCRSSLSELGIRRRPVSSLERGSPGLSRSPRARWRRRSALQRAKTQDLSPGSYRNRARFVLIWDDGGGGGTRSQQRRPPLSFSSLPLRLTFFPSFFPTPFSRKPPGLANEKTVDVTAAPGGAGVAIRTSRPKNASKPSKATSTSVSKKTSARRVASAAGKAAASLRPDLKRAAAAKASALMRASRARKAGSKGGAAVVAADE